MTNPVERYNRAHNKPHVRILREQGVGAWNRWREQNPDMTPDFRDADLRGLTLVGADLRLADFTSDAEPRQNITVLTPETGPVHHTSYRPGECPLWSQPYQCDSSRRRSRFRSTRP